MMKKLLPFFLPALLLLISLIPISVYAQPITLIDVDFGAPHTVGNPPVEGFSGPPPLNTVGEIFSGNPTVVSSLGALTDQPLDLTNSQIRFFLADIPSFQVDVDLPLCDRYTTEADVLIDSSGGGLIIFHDVSEIRRITFLTDLTITATDNFVTFTESQIGTYNLGDVVNVRSEIDLTNDEWKIFLNDALVRTSDFGGATLLVMHRYVGFGSVAVGVDDIRISCPADDEVPPVVGGEFLPIDSTAIMIAGLQTSAIWMLPVLAGAAGAGIAAFKLRRK